MAAVVALNGEPLIRIFVESKGALALGDVGRFFQRVDTGVRRIATRGGGQHRVEIAYLQTGSIELKIKVATLRAAQFSAAVSAAALIVQLVSYLQSDPAAAKSCQALFNGNATIIQIDGGGTSQNITAADIKPGPNLQVRQPLQVVGPRQAAAVITGYQVGRIHRYGGENFVLLESRPGLFIQVRDERTDRSEFLEDGYRYRLEGDAHLASPGDPSFFVLREAMRLDG